MAVADIAKKLNLKPGMQLRTLGKPDNVDLGVASVSAVDGDGPVIAFARTLAEVDVTCDPVVEAARQDQLAWIAYPKAGQLNTDLNRDILWGHMQSKGVEAVRQISLDDVWSAIRFRPAK